MQNNPNLGDKLLIEALIRNKASAIGALFLFGVILANDFSVLTNSKLALLGASLILVFNIVRLSTFNDGLKLIIKKYFSPIVTFASAGWSLFSIGIFKTHEVSHPQALVTLVVLAGISGSAAGSLSSQIRLARTFLIFSLLIPGLYFFTFANGGISLGTVAIAYFLFLLNHSKLSYENLKTILLQKENLHSQQIQLQGVFDSVPGFVSLVDNNLTYKMVNKKLCDYLGKQPNEIVGFKVGFEHRKSQFLDEVTHYLNSKSTNSYNVKIKNSQNNNWYLLSMTLLSSTKDILCMSIDITKEVNLENEANEKQKYLVETAKLAELGEIAAGVAHEINNPLAIIQGKTALLRRRISRDIFEKDYFEASLIKIEQTTDRIANIVRCLVSFSRVAEDEHFTNSYLRKIVNDTLELLKESFARSNITLKIIVPEYFQIYCRPTQMSQSLYQLLANARDAIENQPNPWIEIKCTEKGNNYIISVTDSGNGIPQEIAEKMLLPFFTTKEPGKGTGLGLSLVNNTIKEHKGKFYIDPSSPNTRFVIEISKSVGSFKVA